MGQEQPGLITQEGLLVNGNTRVAALRELNIDHVEVAVLTNNVTETDILDMEMSLQVTDLVHQDYTFTNELLLMKRFLDAGNSEKALAKKMGWMNRGIVKVKELVIEPGKGISYQRHFKRSEMWFVSKGECVVKHGRNTDKPDEYDTINLKTDEVIHIKVGDWHQIVNTKQDPCHIVEIQYGEETNEEDIERLEYYDGE